LSKTAFRNGIRADSIVVVDRGYCDFGLFARWSEQGVYFVTRMKTNIVYEAVEEYEVPAGGHILADQLEPGEPLAAGRHSGGGGGAVSKAGAA
jgi:hypothetical protein